MPSCADGFQNDFLKSNGNNKY
uniref:Uncharacterized protein n=1 Tax=Anguilla anguilla TaxID=7936 RepID=A0A0E9PAA7_ANGAN